MQGEAREMPGATKLVLGPARCGKTDLLLREYRGELAARRPQSALWLVPNQRAAADVRDRLLDRTLRACVSPGIMTFQRLAAEVLAASAAPIKPISGLMQRRLLKDLLRAASQDGRLRYFQPIATKPGLVAQVAQFISDLKRAEVWPDDFERACAQHGATDKDRELVALYRAYQEYLNAHGLYDAEGSFWSARHLLRDGQQAPFERVRLLVVDGFSDFTRTQHEILEMLSQRVERTLISLPLEEGDRRADLFDKPRRTLGRLCQAHGDAELHWMPRRASAWPMMAHLEQHLLADPRDVPPAPEPRGVAILEAAGAVHEIEQIGRCIKLLLTEGDDGQAVRPGQIAVVMRSLGESASLLREVFTRLAVPFTLEAGQPLAEVPLVRALVSLLQLKLDDWPHDRLLAVLGSNYFHPPWKAWRRGGTPIAVERVVRQLQVPSGCRELLDYMRGVSEAPSPADGEEPGDEHHQHTALQRRAATALPVLEKLCEQLDALPQQATLDAWRDALAELANETGLLFHLRRDSSSPLAQRDLQAWQSLRRALRAAAELEHHCHDQRQLTLAELIELVNAIVSDEQVHSAHDESGSVRVLSAYTARSLSFDYLFFAGLAEKAFPPAERDDRLYSEAETQALAETGVALSLPGDRSGEEMLLFYEVLTRAQRKLTFSYPALDAKAQPLLPSPYLNEVMRCAEPHALSQGQLHDLSPVPRGPDGSIFPPASEEQRRVWAVANALDGDSSLYAGLLAAGDRQLLDSMAAGLRVVAARADRDVFSPHEGLFGSAAARDRLAQHYPAEKYWSASALEEYGHCPFKFLLHRLLKLEPLPELALAVDVMTRGNLFHDTVAEVHRQINARHGGAPTSPLQVSPELFQRILAEAIDKHFTTANDAHPLSVAFRQIDRRLVTRWMEKYLDQHGAYEKSKRDDPRLLPAHFEVSFGREDFEEDGISTGEPLVVEVDGERVCIQGRIDRIDIGQHDLQSLFNVLDYKTGSTSYSGKQVQEGDVLQLPLYALAVEELLLRNSEAIAWHSGYWYVQKDGFKRALKQGELAGGIAQCAEDWQWLREETRRRVVERVRAIRDGQFPVFSNDDNCTNYCDYSTVCRVAHVRALEKQWQLPSNSAPATQA